MNIKAIGRWFIRRDAEASGTRMSGWVDRLAILFSTVTGVQSGLVTGVLVFFLMWIIRAIVGYIDLHILKVHAYGIYYITDKAPASVQIKKREK